jgi:hypothetical protein
VRAAAAVLTGLAVLAGCQAPRRSAPPPGKPPAAAVPAPAPAGPFARSWGEYRLHAARRLVAANAGRTFDGPTPDMLLAIPVVEIELNADGSIRRLEVTRQPKQAQDTVPMALDAIRRAAPFGSVAHLPRPWTFTEVFLFNDDRLFKPRTLDQ